MCWSGPIEAGEEVRKPQRDWAAVRGAFRGLMQYPAINSQFDGLAPPGLHQ
jgi:hypothetical protein